MFFLFYYTLNLGALPPLVFIAVDLFETNA